MPRHRGRTPQSRRILKRVFAVFSVLVVLTTTAVVVAYFKFQGNIDTIPIDQRDRPTALATGPSKPLNVLVMGSDTRAGANGQAAGGGVQSTPGLSDTTLLLHLSANRKFAYGVSLPRDAIVTRPDCRTKDGKGTSPGGQIQFNAAYAVGGPACTVRTVEQLTGIRIDHFVVVDFVGFKAMVNAVAGVTVCVPEEVNDTIGNIQLKAGTYTMTGQQALDYNRVRHGLGAPNGDIGRMKRQQYFISQMIKRVVSAGTLANPIRLTRFLDAATSSLTTDPDLADLKKLASLGRSLQSIGLDNVKFITVPFGPYEPDPNRLVWREPQATYLWSLIKKDKPLVNAFAVDALSPGSGKATAKPSAKPSSSASPSAGAATSASPKPTPTSAPTKSAAQRKADAEAAGLCA